MLPGLQKLTFAGKKMVDADRNLEQCALLLCFPPIIPTSLSLRGARCFLLFSSSSTSHCHPCHRRSYGVKYWNAKFPHWPIIMVRHG